MIELTFPKDFDWNTEEGEVMNISLNLMGGLQYEHLSEREKALLEKHGYSNKTEES